MYFKTKMNVFYRKLLCHIIPDPRESFNKHTIITNYSKKVLKLNGRLFHSVSKTPKLCTVFFLYTEYSQRLVKYKSDQIHEQTFYSVHGCNVYKKTKVRYFYPIIPKVDNSHIILSCSLQFWSMYFFFLTTGMFCVVTSITESSN